MKDEERCLLDPVLEGLKESIAEAFQLKARKVMPWYKYRTTDDKNFVQAAKICYRINADPVLFVEAQFHRVGKIDNFQAAFLHSEYVEENYQTYLANHCTEETYVQWYDLYQAQLSYLRNLIQTGMTVETALSKSYVNFKAWFRILITKEPNPEIIDKYQATAYKELKDKANDGLEIFLRKKKFDLKRIL